MDLSLAPPPPRLQELHVETTVGNPVPCLVDGGPWPRLRVLRATCFGSDQTGRSQHSIAVLGTQACAIMPMLRTAHLHWDGRYQLPWLEHHCPQLEDLTLDACDEGRLVDHHPQLLQRLRRLCVGCVCHGVVHPGASSLHAAANLQSLRVCGGLLRPDQSWSLPPTLLRLFVVGDCCESAIAAPSSPAPAHLDLALAFGQTVADHDGWRRFCAPLHMVWCLTTVCANATCSTIRLSLIDDPHRAVPGDWFAKSVARAFVAEHCWDGFVLEAPDCPITSDDMVSLALAWHRRGPRHCVPHPGGGATTRPAGLSRGRRGTRGAPRGAPG